MFKLYCFGDLGEDYNTHYEVERDTISEIMAWIEEKSWYYDYMDKKIKRSNFIPLRLTQINETELMDQHSPTILRTVNESKEKLEQKQLEEDKKNAKKKIEAELKQLEELKKKYPNNA